MTSRRWKRRVRRVARWTDRRRIVFATCNVPRSAIELADVREHFQREIAHAFALDLNDRVRCGTAPIGNDPPMGLLPIRGLG